MDRMVTKAWSEDVKQLICILSEDQEEVQEVIEEYGWQEVYKISTGSYLGYIKTYVLDVDEHRVGLRLRGL